MKTNAEDIKENRDLVSWEAEHGADADLGELENEKGGDWDQFAVSTPLFQLNSDHHLLTFVRLMKRNLESSPLILMTIVLFTLYH